MSGWRSGYSTTSETVAGPPGADALAAPARVSQRSRLRIRTHRTKSSVKFLRGEGSDWLRTEERSERRQQEGAQERRQPPQEEVEVEAGGGEDGVDAVAVLALEVVALRPRIQVAATTTSTRFRVWISGQVRRTTAAIKREMKRRAAVEPVIGHLKADHRMDRNGLKRSGFAHLFLDALASELAATK